MTGRCPVLIVKAARERRAQEDVRRCRERIRRCEQRLDEARSAAAGLSQRRRALVERRARFGGASADLMLCDASIVGLTSLMRTTASIVQEREAGLASARAKHAAAIARWSAVSQGLRIAEETLRRHDRTRAAVGTSADEEESCAMRSASRVATSIREGRVA